MPDEPLRRSLRILHAPANVAGQAGDAVAALRRLGHEVELWEETPEAFGRPPERVLDASRDSRAAWATIREAAERFDVVHFHFGRTLVPRANRDLPPYWDLPVLRALGLGVFFTFHGSEVRIDRIHREINPWSGQFTASSPPDDDRTEKAIQVMRTYADRLFVVSVNYLAYVPDATYLPRLIDRAAWPELPAAQRERPLIVHAPTRRTTKGTDLILAALDGLREEGLAFDLRLLEGLPHAEVRAAMADADLLVDNVVAGSYGIVSLEAMACSKVAVSNMSDALRAAHPDAPVVPVDPDTLRPVLRRLIADRGERQALAVRGRPFVAAVHDADVVAGRLVEAYRAPRRVDRHAAMPDWVSLAPSRRIETLESRLATLEVELARARRRETELRVRLGLSPEAPPSLARRIVRRTVPEPVRRMVRRRLR
jgi:hypothetical protein